MLALMASTQFATQITNQDNQNSAVKHPIKNLFYLILWNILQSLDPRSKTNKEQRKVGSKRKGK